MSEIELPPETEPVRRIRFIVDPSLPREKVDAFLEEVKRAVAEHGGEFRLVNETPAVGVEGEQRDYEVHAKMETIEQTVQTLENFVADDRHAFPADFPTQRRIEALIAEYRRQRLLIETLTAVIKGKPGV